MAGQRVLHSVARTVMLNVVMGVARAGNIDNYAHLGGLLGGVVMAYLFGPKLHIAGWDYNGNPMVVDTPRSYFLNGMNHRGTR